MQHQSLKHQAQSGCGNILDELTSPVVLRRCHLQHRDSTHVIREAQELWQDCDDHVTWAIKHLCQAILIGYGGVTCSREQQCHTSKTHDQRLMQSVVDLLGCFAREVSAM